MKSLLNYLGIILLLLGVICLVIYQLAVQVNGLLITGMVLEVLGILAYIFVKKYN